MWAYYDLESSIPLAEYSTRLNRGLCGSPPPALAAVPGTDSFLSFCRPKREGCTCTLFSIQSSGSIRRCVVFELSTSCAGTRLRLRLPRN